MELKTDVDDGTATLAWLMGALEYARAQEQAKLEEYLKTVANEVVFEMESVRHNG